MEYADREGVCVPDWNKILTSDRRSGRRLTIAGKRVFSWPWIRWQSLHVLHLLADFLQLGFRLHHGLGDGCVVGLGADGVELAEQLLAEEIQGAARWFGGVEVFPEFGEMGFEAGDFLADVAAIGE